MLPEAVRKQGERADALYQQAYGKPGEAPAPAPAVSASAPDTQPQPQASAPAPAPSAEPAPAPAAAAPVAPAPVGDDASWEQKYRVLAGKYAAEVPRMAADLRAANSTIGELKAKVSELEAKSVQAPSPEGLTPQSVVETYGEDFAKAVAAIVQPMVTGVRDDLKARVDETAQATEVASRQAFMRDLTGLVPDWMVIDTDPRFTAFLDEVDPMAGRPRRHFFNEADSTNDAPRIAQFFTRFREKVQGQQAPAALAPATPAPAEGPSAIDTMLQPSSSRADTPLPPGKRMWTQADIRKFYVDARRGLYSPQEYARIESDIFAAQGEGRLVA